MAVATYKGISTVNNDFGSIKLTDTDLIKEIYLIILHFVKVKNL